MIKLDYTAFVDAVAGLADNKSVLHASEQEYIAKVDPDFGHLVEEKKHEKLAEEVEFINREAPAAGEADDRKRVRISLGEQFFENANPIYDQNGYK